MKKNLKIIILLIAGLPFLYDNINAQVKRSNLGTKNFHLGIDNSGDKCKPGEFFNAAAMDALGVDFVIYK